MSLMETSGVDQFKFLEASLIANLETIGPMFVASANPDFFTMDARVLFASRVVILTGMGNQNTPLFEIQGPVPISEIEDQNYSFYLYQTRPEKDEYTNLHLIIALVFHSSIRSRLKSQEDRIEAVLHEMQEQFEFASFEMGIVAPEVTQKYETVLRHLLEKINSVLEPPGAEGSLFDISFVSQFEGNLASVAKRFTLSPKGISRDELSDYLKEIEYLRNKGLIIEQHKEGTVWYIPR